MNMKTTLTIEESARLIELGVDAKLASETIIGCDDNNKAYRRYRFSLTDILSILPKEIDYNVLDILATGFDPKTGDIKKGWTASYITEQGIVAFGEESILSAPELIDALNQLLIWCLTEKKINLNQTDI